MGSGMPWYLVDLVLVAAAVLLLEGRDEWDARTKGKTLGRFHRLVGPLMDSLLIGLIAAAWVEIPFVSHLLGVEMNRVLAYSRNFGDSEFLRKHFSTTELKDFRSATIEAVRGRPLLPGEKDLFDVVLGEAIGNHLRSELKIDREQDLIEASTSAREPYFRVVEDTHFVVHAGAFGDSVLLPIYGDMKPIPGVADTLLYRLTSFVIGEHELDPLPHPQPLHTKTGTVRFDGRMKYFVRGDVDVRYITEKRIPAQDQATTWLNAPTEGLTYSLRYTPQSLDPKLYVFGMGNKAPADIVPTGVPGHLQWEYSGWLVRKQGCVLTWTLPQRGGVVHTSLR
jgi:hypothetical protein